MWDWLRCECWCCGFGKFAASFLSLFVFLCVRVVSTLSSGYVRAPLPYRLVNAGLFDYKKKKKKNFIPSKRWRPLNLINWVGKLGEQAVGVVIQDHESKLLHSLQYESV